MQNIFSVFILLSIIACTASRQATTPMVANNGVVAHRGAFKKQGFPENSIASLREAIRLGCAGSEFDVRMTADDSLVINHDPHYRQLQIEKTEYKALVQMPLANGEPLPTLRSYLLAGLRDNPSTRLVVEIKPSDLGEDRARTIAEKVVRLVQELGAPAKVVYISFDYDILKRIEELDARAQTQYLTGDRTPDQLKTDGIDGADYHFSVFQKNPEWVSLAKEKGLVLNAWTVNEATDMQRLMAQGFDFITTNEPELLLSLKASKQ